MSIALAEAAGRTVRAAVIRPSRPTRCSGRPKKSHGENTAEVNQARAGAISAEASVRDARLQDDLDTIDFNLQMGKITQSAAIHALQEILRTRDLTRDQRRQLMLQIKGMKAEMADSQWNFGDIKLPTPYQMRRYIEQRREQFRHDMDGAAGATATKPPAGDHGCRIGGPAPLPDHDHQHRRCRHRDGPQVIKEVVGGSVNVGRRARGGTGTDGTARGSQQRWLRRMPTRRARSPSTRRPASVEPTARSDQEDPGLEHLSLRRCGHLQRHHGDRPGRDGSDARRNLEHRRCRLPGALPNAVTFDSATTYVFSVMDQE